MARRTGVPNAMFAPRPDGFSQSKARQLAREDDKGNGAVRLGSRAQLEPGKRESVHICSPHFSRVGIWEPKVPGCLE